jgi:hypothetical protein
LSNGESFEMTDEEEEITTVVLCQRRDGQPLIGAGIRRFDEPFLLQPVQRTAHRCAAEVEPCGDGALDDATAGGQLS